MTSVTAKAFQTSKSSHRDVLGNPLGVHMQGMDNAHRRKNFTPADDKLIRQQPLTGISIKRLADILRSNQETIRHRATELGVSLIFAVENDGAIDTRTFRCTDGFVDPLLERLRVVHGK